MPFHADYTGVDIHTPYTWSYADAAARTGATGFVSGDLFKFAYQEDDGSTWVLTAITPTWAAVGGSGGIPPALANASFITRTSETSLSNETAMGSLATGLVKNTTTTGTPSIAVAGTDYVAPSTTISTTAPLTGGGDLSTNRTIAVSTMTGDSGSGGARGVVPAPAAGDAAANKFLKADATWGVPSGTGAPSDAHYVTTQAETGLSNEFSLGTLTTGMLKHTVSGSVSTPATAVEGTDYYKPGGTDVALADGGTGSSTAAGARANLIVAGYNDAGNSSTALTIDWSVAHTQKVTLTGNCTFTFSNPVAGDVYVLHLFQDGTGSRTVTWPAAVKWASGTAPTLTTTASKVDIVTFSYDGTDYFGVTSGQNYTP